MNCGKMTVVEEGFDDRHHLRLSSSAQFINGRFLGCPFTGALLFGFYCCRDFDGTGKTSSRS